MAVNIAAMIPQSTPGIQMMISISPITKNLRAEVIPSLFDLAAYTVPITAITRHGKGVKIRKNDTAKTKAIAVASLPVDR